MQVARRDGNGEDRDHDQEHVEEGGEAVGDHRVAKSRPVLTPQRDRGDQRAEQADHGHGRQPAAAVGWHDELEEEHDDGGAGHHQLREDDAVVDADAADVDRHRNSTGSALTVASTAAGKKAGVTPISTINASSGASTTTSAARSSPKPAGCGGASCVEPW